MNWGKGIFIVIVVFMLGTLSMVYLAVNQEFPLVADDYYQQELDYDNQLERMNNHNTNGLLRIEHIRKSLVITSKQTNVEVKIHFYRPSNKELDKHFNFDINEETHEINLTEYRKGLYVAKVLYQNDDKEYYTEIEVML